MNDKIKQTILIVDDNPTNIRVLVEILKNEYDIRIATNGKTALNLANRPDKPDLILLDIMMPEMDGYEVCRQLKANDATRDIPVIFITSKSEKDDEELGLSLGAMDYIAKPFELSIVKARIRNHLMMKYQRDELIRQKEALDNAMNQIKILRGFLPICCMCKKIRDDKGYWSQIEVYIRDHSEAEFSHGICPDCLKKHYPDFSEKHPENQ